MDNLSGSVVLDRKLRVDHSNYKGEYVREGEEEDYQRREAERLRNVLPETLKPEEIRALSKADKVDTKLVELEAQLQGILVQVTNSCPRLRPRGPHVYSSSRPNCRQKGKIARKGPGKGGQTRVQKGKAFSFMTLGDLHYVDVKKEFL